MNIVNGFDIDTTEGARKYLESEGFDVDKEIQKGMKIIKEIKKKIALKK